MEYCSACCSKLGNRTYNGYQAKEEHIVITPAYELKLVETTKIVFCLGRRNKGVLETIKHTAEGLKKRKRR